jgi:hypothetical protein
MHLVKAIHILKADEAAYGFKNGLYLKTTIITVDNVNPENPWEAAIDTPKYLLSLKNK